jgi:hypothetical protein
MVSAAPAFQTGKDSSDLLPWENKKHFQEIFSAQAVRSYVLLSFGMGVVAFLLPIVLPIAGGYQGHYSISYFYHVSDLTRNILVGALWATGVFLILFHGLSKRENWLLNIAGIAAISVAMNPMPDNQGNNDLTLHAASAILFFACIAIVAVFLSKERIKYIVYPPKRRRFAAAYDAAGVAMIAMPVAVAAIHFLGGTKEESHWIYWIEAFGIWSFAAYWFVKTFEYCLLLRIKLKLGTLQLNARAPRTKAGAPKRKTRTKPKSSRASRT